MTDNPGISQQMQSETTPVEGNPYNEPEAGAEPLVIDTEESVDQELAEEVAGASAESAVKPEDPQKDAAHQTAIDTLTREVETLKAQLEERSGQYMRIAADFDNFRKRTQKEKEDLEQQVKRSTVVELLPVVDNFERARSQIKPQTEPEMTIHKSYQGVYKDLVDRLKRIGVAPMRAEGKEFDPNLHEAVMREMTDEYPEGTVVEELVRGYLLGDGVLRHAMVKVAAAPEPVIPSEEDQGNPEE